ncbi:MAG: flagellar biosynthesis protein FlgH [Candidatus Omnitrophota bacterium]|nr:MAG: flagellar biosynthesis protein FlgH [Candidatus Omnitrophota bacterium]
MGIKVTLAMLLMFCFINQDSVYAVSLWQAENAQSASFFVDHKARQIDDIITVLISENSSASRTASTKTGRSSQVEDKIEQWFTVNGLRNVFKGLLGKGTDVQSDPANSSILPQIKLSAKKDFQGSGTTSRNDKFKARITCKVVDVLPNNNLVIEGKQNVSVNAEEQIIVLNGVVRSEDVSAGNIVYSYNVADAKISYLGKGPIGDKQKRGFLEWFGDTIWPF